MAGPKAHVDVAERRLRPVYDALDNLNNKQAIKLADSILKKQKDLLCAKALKSLALIRSGRSNEGVELLNEIKMADVKMDDSTLQAITMCYKETNMPDGIVAIYEVAVQQTPKNEEFLSHFFMSCVRVEDYTKQHKAAMNLYKAFPKNPYYFWAVMSNFMQALYTKDTKKKNMFLNLAERMVSKFIKEDKIEAEEEVRLYMLILEHLCKYEELLKLVQSDFGDKLRCVLNEKSEKEIEYLTKLSKWVEVNIKYKSVLQKSPDQWSYYIGYFDSIEKLKAIGYQPDMPIDTENIQPDYSAESTLETLNNLREACPIMRGPFLSLMEFQKCSSKEATPELIELLHEYYNEYGKKLCCFSDIKQYADQLNQHERRQFIEHLKTTYQVHEVTDEETPHKEKVEDLMREICVECLCRQLGYYNDLTHEEKFMKAKLYMKRYNDTLQLAGHLNSTEPQYGDTLVLLAAYLLLDINKEKGDNSMLWHVLLILEEALESSPTFSQFKLLLLFLYTKLGAYGACDELMLEIEVKYIMYDSLGYLLTYGGYTSGQFQATLRLHDASIGFYTACAKDTPEQIIASYKYGSFRQIPEITRFKNRVKTSYQFSYIVLESLYLDLLRFANSVKETKERFDKVKSILDSLEIKDLSSIELSDNRDFTVMDNFEPLPEYLTEEQKVSSFKQNLCWIRLRYLLLQLVHHCVKKRDHVDNTKNDDTGIINGDSETPPSSVDNSLQEIEKAIGEANSFTSEEEETWSNMQHPPPCYLLGYVKEQHYKVIMTIASVCSLLHSTLDIDDECVSTINASLKTAEQIMKGNLTDISGKLTTSHGENSMFNGNSLSSVIFYVETCNLVGALLHAVKELVKGKLLELRRSKKKKGPQPATKHDLVSASVKDLIQSLTTDMTSLLERLGEVKRGYVDRTLDDSVLEELFEKTNSTTVTRIWQKIQASYQQSINEISQVLNFKINFFKLLN